jgi:Na+-transporting NADH:ubiquinone oxidoreductase subunit F
MFLNALIFINAFALCIGVLIIFLDRVISRYDECTIRINDDKELQVRGGKSLLRILFENGYFIPSACGGKGTCGYCRVKVAGGGGDALPTEGLILSSKEIREGYRLACQLKVRNDLSIFIPPEYLEIKEYEAEIEYTELATSDIRKLRLHVLTEDEITFKPGQYVQIKIEMDGGVEYRAYSIASHPDEHRTIELNVKHIPEGIGSGYLHRVKKREQVQFSGPYGDFYLQTDTSRPIICVAGGVGLAPIKSIILYWDSMETDRPVSFFYGARTRKDLYDHDVFLEIAERNSNFSYYPALSEEDLGWEGERGFIHLVMKEQLKDSSHTEAYLCGPPIMIDAVTEVLKSKGVPEERILYDKF